MDLVALAFSSRWKNACHALPAPVAQQHAAPIRLVEVAPRHVERDARLVAVRTRRALVPRVLEGVWNGLTAPSPDRSRGIGHDEVPVDAGGPAEAVAGGAGAERAVEARTGSASPVGSRGRTRRSAVPRRSGAARRRASGRATHGAPVAGPEGGLERVDEARAGRPARDHAIDDDEEPARRRQVGAAGRDVLDVTVDEDPRQARGAQVVGRLGRRAPAPIAQLEAEDRRACRVGRRADGGGRGGRALRAGPGGRSPGSQRRRPSPRGASGGRAARVMVPTVERLPRRGGGARWPRPGGCPRRASTSGRSMRSRNWRA